MEQKWLQAEYVRGCFGDTLIFKDMTHNYICTRVCMLAMRFFGRFGSVYQQKANETCVNFLVVPCFSLRIVSVSRPDSRIIVYTKLRVVSRCIFLRDIQVKVMRMFVVVSHFDFPLTLTFFRIGFLVYFLA